MRGVAIIFGLLIVAGAIGSMTGGAPEDNDAAATRTPPRTTVASTTTPGTPAPPTPSPEPTAFSFGPGVLTVGTDVPAGTYRTRSSTSTCYWARLSGFGGTLGEVIANNLGSGYAVVAIAPDDVGFESQGCGAWSADLSAVKAPDAPFGNGTFIVGTDITPGAWRAAGGSTCYWARLSGFGGSTLGDIIANHIGEGAAVVQIQASDVGFTSSGCGEWTKAN
ncbi:MAG: hypothetical protein ACRDM0_05400 [Thermoleophilaceae bacterium]